jgi:hypothetical protein
MVGQWPLVAIFMNKYTSHQRPRQGGVLIVVVGLSVMILALTMTYITRIRSSGDETRLVIEEAQARLMLHAALMYLQEGSRIGWSDRALETGSGVISSGWRGQIGLSTFASVSGVRDHGGETFGWTDLRTGWLGPLAARDPATGAIPAPRWWTDHSSKPYDPLPNDNALPAVPDRVWPCPGAVVRCEMYRETRPPHAILGIANPNPLRPRDAVYGDPGFDTPWSTRPAADLVYNADYLGALDPQPVAATWNEFDSGNRTAIEATRNIAWFRIYREVLADHDNDGTPWYDSVAVVDTVHRSKNWNVFVITAGSGASRGYRDWGEVPAGLFVDEQHFDEVRARERLLWFRVEWSGMQGGSWSATAEARNGKDPDADQQTNSDEVAGFTARSFGGHFTWI